VEDREEIPDVQIPPLAQRQDQLHGEVHAEPGRADCVRTVGALPCTEENVVDVIQRRRRQVEREMVVSLRHWPCHYITGDPMERFFIIRPQSLAVSQGIVQLRGREIMSRSPVHRDMQMQD